MSEFVAGVVTVPVVPDAKGFVTKLRERVLGDAYRVGRDVGREVTRGISDAIKSARVEVDTAAADAALAVTRRALDEIDGRRAEAGVDVDAAAAGAQLAAVEAGLEHLDGRTAHVDVEVDSKGLLGSVKRAAVAAGGAAVDALGGAFRAASAAAGPVLIGGLVGVVAAGGPAIGAALGGALVLGLGAGFVGIGALLLLENEKIKKEFAKTGAEIKTIMTDASKPLVPVFHDALDGVEALVKDFNPVFKSAFQEAQGPLKDFIRSFLDGVREFKPAVQPIMDAFTDILDQLGPQMKGIFRDIADSVIDLSKTASENKTLIAAIFAGLLKAVPLVISGISGVVKLFSTMASTANGVSVGLAKTFSGAATIVLGFAEKFLGAIRSVAQAVGNIPGMEGISKKLTAGIDEALGKIGEYKREAQSASKAVELRADIFDLTQKIDKAQALLNDPNLTKERRAQINADIQRLQVAKAKAVAELGDPKLVAEYKSAISTEIGTLQSRLATARKELGDKDLTRERRSKLNADIAQLLAQVKAAKAALDTVKDKTVTITVQERYKQARKTEAQRNRRMGGIDAYARGGIREATRAIGPVITSRPTVLFGEGKGKEAFVPYERRFRKRATAILGQVAADFGYQLTRVGTRQAAESVMRASVAQTLPAGAPVMATGSAAGGLRVAVDNLATFKASLDAVGGGLTEQLAGARGRLTATLGETGTLTKTLDGVGKSADRVATATAGSSTSLAKAIASVTSATAKLTAAINALSSAIAKAGAAAKSSGGNAKTKKTGKKTKWETVGGPLRDSNWKTVGAPLRDRPKNRVEGSSGSGGAEFFIEAAFEAALEGSRPVFEWAGETIGATAAAAFGGVAAGSVARTLPIKTPTAGPKLDALRRRKADPAVTLGPDAALYSGVYQEQAAKDSQALFARLAHESGGGQSGTAPLVNIEHMPVTPEQSPYAIAKDLRYLLGSQVRLR